MKFPRIGSLKIVNESPGITKQVRGNVVKYTVPAAKKDELETAIKNLGYEKGDLIGSGTYGVVYYGCKKSEDCGIVIKAELLKPDAEDGFNTEMKINKELMRMYNSKEISEQDRFFPKFFSSKIENATNEEFKKKLNNLSFGVLDIKNVNKVGYSVFEFYGENLRKIVVKIENEMKSLPENQESLDEIENKLNNLEIKNLLKVLNNMHKHDIYHLDLGERNIQFNENDKKYMIIDYGQAKNLKNDDDLTSLEDSFQIYNELYLLKLCLIFYDYCILFKDIQFILSTSNNLQLYRQNLYNIFNYYIIIKPIVDNYLYICNGEYDKIEFEWINFNTFFSFLSMDDKCLNDLLKGKLFTLTIKDAIEDLDRNEITKKIKKEIKLQFPNKYSDKCFDLSIKIYQAFCYKYYSYMFDFDFDDEQKKIDSLMKNELKNNKQFVN